MQMNEQTAAQIRYNFTIVRSFVNFLTLLLFIIKITLGWPATWLLVFTPLIVWWAFWLCALLVRG